MTSVYESFPIGATINFEVYPNEVLGSGFKSLVIEAIVDHETTKFFKLDPAALHAQVYSRLPVGTPNDYRSYSYLKLRHPNGEVQCIGIPWIRLDTVAVVTTQTVVAKVFNAATADLEQIRLLLVAAGYDNIEIGLE